MKIDGPGMPPEKVAVGRNAGRPSSEANSQSVKTGAQAVSGDAAFLERAADIPASEMTALRAELALLGLTPDSIDNATLLRALILKRNAIPLEPSLLSATHDIAPALAERLTALLSDARALLATDIALPPEIRSAVVEFADSIEALLASTATPKESPAKTIDLWAETVVSRLAAALNGDISALTSVEPDSFFVPFSGNKNPLLPADTTAADIVAMFRAAASSASSLAGEAFELSSGAPADIRTALAGLINGMTEVSRNLEAFVATNGIAAPAGGGIKVFFDSAVAALLLRLSGEGAIALDSDLLSEGISSSGIRNTIQQSGMVFEWRLLAWFRSGADPGRLADIMRNDLKGIVGMFLARLRNARSKGKSSPAGRALERQAAEIAETITGRQLSAITNRSFGEQKLTLEAPFGGFDSRGMYSLKVFGGNERDESGGRTYPLRFSFAVETSAMGTVDVQMTVMNGVADVICVIGNDTGRKNAENAADELRTALASRGLHVASLRFAGKDDAAESSHRNDSDEKKAQIDFRG